MGIENFVTELVIGSVRGLFGEPEAGTVQVQKTRREFEGDYTLVVFPLLKLTRKGPEQSAEIIGERLMADAPEIVAGYNVVKGFLNISFGAQFWAERFAEIAADGNYGRGEPTGRTLMVEYSSPNTNKPLHLGHIRNNLLGCSVARILEAAGNRVVKANLVNDRGIHICKSMIAWQKYGGGETPESSGMKGDHLVGKYYVEFDKHYKAEVAALVASGVAEDEAMRAAPIMAEAQEMLRRWEAHDTEVYSLWERMNGWVYEGFEATYKALGVEFDKVYHESQTYLLGKSMVEEGLARGVFYRRDDGSVWVDLTADGLDNKLLLRSDGTSVYMTQDIGTAFSRFEQESLDGIIYVVGNEQNYHFQALKLIVARLGHRDWAESIHHLSYGMVELPEGRMKSREGTVVDADDLVASMTATAREMSTELGKLDDATREEAAEVSRMVGMAALKYFILKVDPRKTMLFNPRESIDFNGNTGPFIQYAYARIRSLLRKAGDAPAAEGLVLGTPEVELVKRLCDLPQVVAAAAAEYSPATVASYVYELAKNYNGYYHDHPVLREENVPLRATRLALSAQTARAIAFGMSLLGIELPERM